MHIATGGQAIQPANQSNISHPLPKTKIKEDAGGLAARFGDLVPSVPHTPATSPAARIPGLSAAITKPRV